MEYILIGLMIAIGFYLLPLALAFLIGVGAVLLKTIELILEVIFRERK